MMEDIFMALMTPSSRAATNPEQAPTAANNRQQNQYSVNQAKLNKAISVRDRYTCANAGAIRLGSANPDAARLPKMVSPGHDSELRFQ